MTARLVPALEIGGTHVAGALVSTATWDIVAGTSCRRALDPHGSAQEILAEVLQCANSLGARPMQRWGVALPGPFDYARGIGLFEGVAKFEALYGVDVGRVLLNGLRPRASGVAFINDADAFMLGEWVAGSASRHRRAVGITLGTGVGSSFLADGVVVEDDPSVPPEGRVDLLAVDGRPLEDIVSRRAILARYASLAGAQTETDLDVRDIADRARSGDSIAQQVLGQAFTTLGVALAPWLARFGASVLVVGGSITDSWDLVAGPLRKGLGAAGVALQVVRATRPSDAALIGAVYHALGQSGL